MRINRKLQAAEQAVVHVVVVAVCVCVCVCVVGAGADGIVCLTTAVYGSR